jgi:hypothetical protein
MSHHLIMSANLRVSNSGPARRVAGDSIHGVRMADPTLRDIANPGMSATPAIEDA